MERGFFGSEFQKGMYLGHCDEFFSASNWMCARDARWRFPVKIPIWTLAGRCGRVFGWKSEMDPSWRIWRGDWLENCEWIPAGKSGRIFGQNSGRPPGWGNWTEFLSENVKVNCSVKWMEMWSDGLKEDVAWFNG